MEEFQHPVSTLYSASTEFEFRYLEADVRVIRSRQGNETSARGMHRPTSTFAVCAQREKEKKRKKEIEKRKKGEIPMTHRRGDTKAEKKKRRKIYIYIYISRDSSDDDIVSIRHPSPRFNGSASLPVSTQQRSSADHSTHRTSIEPRRSVCRTLLRASRKSALVDRHGSWTVAPRATRSHGSLFTVHVCEKVGGTRRKLIFAIPVIVRVRQVYARISGREKLARRLVASV